MSSDLQNQQSEHASQEIPVRTRRIVVNDPSQMPLEYGTTPGGSIFSTTPGGKLFNVVYNCYNYIFVY